ncbi:hypothetical protein N9Y16_05810 [Gammaproteobacteria bacterium]|nr:hypothetical protein [Gammaproteobacteria bacterium]
MAALRTLSYLTRAAMLIACAWVFSAAAQDSEQSAAQVVETGEASAAQQQESAQDTELAGDVSAQDADSEEESGARFIPTEEISQDFGVSFPVDI